MALQDQLYISGAWVASVARFVNTTGTPLLSSADNGSGEALADVYTLTLSAVGGGTATVTVGTSSPNNPYKGRVATGVALDGATAYRNIIPGIILVFTNTGANGNVATVSVGLYEGTFDSFGAGAGDPSTPVRHRVVNTGSGAVSNAEARLLPNATLVKKTGSALSLVKPFAEGATEKTQGGGSDRNVPYALSISAIAGSGATKTATLSVDGVAVPAGQLTDLTTGVDQGGTLVKAITPAYMYRFKAPHVLAGLEFALDPACANGDVANVMIHAVRNVQITDEVAGAPDDPDWGTDDVTLTQAGQSAGVIQPGGEAFFYTRIVVPAGASAEKNPHPSNVALTATETGSANWLA